MSRKLRILIIFTLVSSLLLACGRVDSLEAEEKQDLGQQRQEKIEATYGGEIALPITNIRSINPITTENLSYYYFSKLIYDGLFEVGNDLKMQPLLAESYSISDGGKLIDIKLREDVNWHDGQALSAEDVIFTLDVIKTAGKNSLYGKYLDQCLGYYGSNINQAIRMEGSGKNLRVIFNQPYGNNLEALSFPILPKHRFKTARQALVDKNFPLIGTGAFKFEDHTPLKTISLVRNDDYFAGKPYLDRVVGKIYPNKDDAMVAFETGQVNTALTVGIDWESYGKNSRFKVIEFPSAEYEFLAFNFRNPILASEDGLKIRRAIAYGIDRQKIIEKVYLEHASTTDLPIHINSWLNLESFYGYNKEKAREILNQTPYYKLDAEGYRIDEAGKRLSFNLLTNSLNPLRLFTADHIKKDLKELGIELKLIPEVDAEKSISREDRDRHWQAVQADIRASRYDLLLSGWRQNEICSLESLFNSSNRDGGNINSYRDEEMDRLLYASYYSGESRDAKEKAYEELNKKIIEDLPYVSLFYKNKALVMDKRYYGDMDPSFINPYRGLNKLFIHIEENKVDSE